MPLLRLPILGWGELRQQKHNGSQQTFRTVVEESILAVLCSVAVRVDDSLGEDLGVFLCARSGSEVLRMHARNIHVVIHQRQEIEAVRAGWVAQVDDGYLVAVIPGGDGTVVARQVSLGVQRQIAHTAGAGILQICV